MPRWLVFYIPDWWYWVWKSTWQVVSLGWWVNAKIEWARFQLQSTSKVTFYILEREEVFIIQFSPLKRFKGFLTTSIFRQGETGRKWQRSDWKFQGPRSKYQVIQGVYRLDLGWFTKDSSRKSLCYYWSLFCDLNRSSYSLPSFPVSPSPEYWFKSALLRPSIFHYKSNL